MEDQKIDESLYSRQLYVLGEDAMKKMGHSSALIIGMKGLGVEIAKNIILAGIKNVSIFDNEAACIKDLSTNFYITEEDIGKPRAEICLPKLRDLNPFVTVTRRVEEITEDYIKSFRVVVATSLPNKEQETLDAICHANNVCFIGVNNYGLAVRIFCDFGESFYVSDIDDSEPGTVLVGDISRDKEGLVTIAEDRHPFQDGDLVTFSDIRGMVELNGCAPRAVHVLGPQQFTIGDTSSLSPYESFGWCTQVKQPKTLRFLELRKANRRPEDLSFTDFGKMDHAIALHVAVLTLDRFIEQVGHVPRPWNDEDAEIFVQLAREVNQSIDADLRPAELNETVLKTFAMTCCGEICPITAAFGGIAGQEVLKACSGKFAPIQQFLYYDAFEALPPRGDHADCREIGSRYDGQIVVFGETLQEQLEKSRVFLVGAGAIGCEMLKNLALMGVGTAGDGAILVTDMDRIERSNLSRQFLFRNTDIGQSKAGTAVRAIRSMNPAVKCEFFEAKVGPETENLFSDAFFERLTLVCNALDNVEARKYVDSRCVRFDKPLLESGTLGTRGNTQIIVPFLTESYGATNDPQEEKIPLCTLKNYPYKIEHTIQWARDIFEGLFAQSIQTLGAYRDTRGYLDSIAEKVDVHDEAVRQLHELLVDSPCVSFDDCVRWAAKLFRKLFYTEICQLVYQFPRDFVDSNGNKFWSGNKLYPSSIEFDETNPVHVDFVRYAAYLHAENLGIPKIEDDSHLLQVLKTVEFPAFVPDTNTTNTNEIIAKLAAELPDPAVLQSVRSIPAEFEKDDDANHHIDFIAACANLRAANYGITQTDRNTVKKISGKIIPAISTTTAFVTGAVAVELFKLTAGMKEIESYRSCFANLSMPMLCFTEPGPCKKITAGKKSFTEWDHVTLRKADGKTFKALAEYLSREFEVSLDAVYCGSFRLYDAYDTKDRENREIVEVYREVTKKETEPWMRYIEVLAFCSPEGAEDDLMADDVDLPSIFVEI